MKDLISKIRLAITTFNKVIAGEYPAPINMTVEKMDKQCCFLTQVLEAALENETAGIIATQAFIKFVSSEDSEIGEHMRIYFEEISLAEAIKDAEDFDNWMIQCREEAEEKSRLNMIAMLAN